MKKHHFRYYKPKKVALNELMWNNMHCSAVSPVIEPACSNAVHSNKEVSDKTCIN